MSKKIVQIGLVVAAIAVNVIPGAGQAISAAIGSGLLGAGASVGVAFTAFTAATSIITLAGVSAASGLFGPKAPKTELSQLSRLNASLVPTAARKGVFGLTAMGCDVRYMEPSGSDQEYVDYIIVVAAHRIASFQSIWFEDLLAWTNAGVTAKYAGYLTVDVRLEGNAANAVKINGGAKWGTACRLTGCAYVHLRMKRTGNGKKASSPLINALPSRVTIIGEGMPLYDPRYDSTVPGGSGPMRIDDQTTWQFAYGGRNQGGNTALQSLAAALGWRINGKLSAGGGIQPSRIDLAAYVTAANLCDEGIIKADGTVTPRYRSAGVFSEADNPQSVQAVLMDACNGRLRDAGGKLSIWLAHNDLATSVTDAGLNDDHVLSGFTWEPEATLEQTYNIVRWYTAMSCRA